MKRNRKLICITVIILLMSAMFAGCGGKTAVDTSDKTDFVYRIKSEPSTLDYARVSDLTAFSVLYQLGDTLILEDKNGEIAPGLAESWEFINEDTVLRLHLRNDVKFHNGELMTADDVVFSLNRSIADPITVLSTTAMKEAVKVDDYTVDLALKHAFAPILWCLTQPNTLIASEKAVKEIGEDKFGRAPVYSGAYKLVNWVQGDSIVLAANEDYWGGAPKIKDLTFKIITDPNTAAMALQTGEINFMEDPDAADRESLINAENLAYYETPQAGTYYIAFNNETGKFADEKLREAVCLTVDRDAIVEGTFNGAATAISNPFPPSVFGYDSSIQGKERDIAKAKQLVIDAGYPNGFTVTTYATDDPIYLKPTEILQSQLAEIGITMKIEKMERGSWLTKICNKMEYEIAVVGLIASYPDADYEWVEYHSSEAHKFNYMLTNSPELDKYLETGRYSMDPAVRQPAYSGLAQYLVDHSNVCPMFIKMNTAVCNKNLKGVAAHQLGRYHVSDYSW